MVDTALKKSYNRIGQVCVKESLIMAEYKYETHLHTCQGSACGRLTGEEQADLYKGFGYTGIVVTDHFFN